MMTHDETLPEKRIGTPSSSRDCATCPAHRRSPTRPPHRGFHDAEQ